MKLKILFGLFFLIFFKQNSALDNFLGSLVQFDVTNLYKTYLNNLISQKEWNGYEKIILEIFLNNYKTLQIKDITELQNLLTFLKEKKLFFTAGEDKEKLQQRITKLANQYKITKLQTQLEAIQKINELYASKKFQFMRSRL